MKEWDKTENTQRKAKKPQNIKNPTLKELSSLSKKHLKQFWFKVSTINQILLEQ